MFRGRFLNDESESQRKSVSYEGKKPPAKSRRLAAAGNSSVTSRKVFATTYFDWERGYKERASAQWQEALAWPKFVLEESQCPAAAGKRLAVLAGHRNPARQDA
jgi:hypothetical protein